MDEWIGLYTITIDDDSQVHKLISRFTGLPSLPFNSVERLLDNRASYKPTAVFVDVHLGTQESGLDAIGQLRSRFPFVPLIVITADPDPGLIGKALCKGANDFIHKPLSPQEFLARLEARIHECHERQDVEEYDLCGVLFRRRTGTLSKGGHTVYLPPLEAELLTYLARNLGIVTSKAAVREHLWGQIKVTSNSLDKKISNVRKALSQFSSPIELHTAYGGKICLRISESERKRRIRVRTAS